MKDARARRLPRRAPLSLLLPALCLAPPAVAETPVAGPAIVDPAPAPSPCTVSLISPRATEVLYGTVEIRAEIACPGGAGPSEVELIVDGRVVGRADAPPYRAAWDAGGSFAARLVEARLRDREGRIARAVLMTPGAALREAVRVASTPLDLVELSVTVRDRDGRFVQGLTRDDFVVREAGRERRVEEAVPEKRSLSVAVLVDVSSSTTDLWPRLRQAAPAFARTLGPDDAAKVIAFSGPAYLVQDFTRDPGAIATALQRFRRWGGGTSLYDTLAAVGVELAWGRQGRQAVVLLTDGIDTLSRIDVPRLLDYLRRTDVTIETFLLRPDGATATPGYSRFLHDIESLSRETGGSLRVLPDLDRIEAAFSDLGRELQNRYHLTYHSDRAGREGGWRAIEIRTRTPGTTVRARAGTIGSRDIADYLLDDLKSGDAAARTKAADWLGTLGSSGVGGSAGRPIDDAAAEALLEGLDDRSLEVRAAAARSLGRIRELRAIAPLVALLSDHDEGLRRAAAEALGIFGPAAVPGLLETLETGRPEGQMKAIAVLARIGDTRGIDAITRLAQPPPPMTAPLDREEERRMRERRADPRLRAWALWGLGTVARPAGIPILLKGTADSDAMISRAARTGLLATLEAMSGRGELRAWIVQGGGAEVFLRIVERELGAEAQPLPAMAGFAPATTPDDAFGLKEDLLRALGGKGQAEALLLEIAAGAPSDRVERARSLIARLR